MLTVHCIFCKGLLGLFTLYSQNTLSRFIHLGMDSITSISDLSINQIHKIQITMRYFFDRDGNYAGTSMQGWEILLLLLFPVALIIFLVFLPFYVFHKYSSREEDKKYEEEHPEILKVDSYITCWYPWNRFLALPINHPMEANEMAMKIHDIQRMIISRPGFRLNQEMFKGYGKGNSDKG